MEFITIYVVAIIIVSAIMIAINVRLLRREKKDSAGGAMTASPSEMQRSETISEPTVETEPSRAPVDPIARPTDDDYRNALRRLSGHSTPDKTFASDEDRLVSSDDAYREALRSMMNDTQDSR